MKNQYYIEMECYNGGCRIGLLNGKRWLEYGHDMIKDLFQDIGWTESDLNRLKLIK